MEKLPTVAGSTGISRVNFMKMRRRPQGTLSILTVISAACFVIVCSDSTGPAANPDGMIVFTAPDGIHIIDLSDSTDALIHDSTSDAHIRGITIAPDGSNIVFPVFSFGQSTGFIREWKLHRILTDGSGLTLMYDRTGPEGHPAYGPEGRLAYWGQNGLYVDGTVVYEGNWLEDEMRLTWSPDGAFIVFPYLYRLVRVSVDGSTDPEFLELADGYFYYLADPAYSPNGNQIAFVRAVSSTNREIWVMDVDGTNEYRLTTGFRDSQPAWGPDGEQLMFIRSQASTYLVDAAPESVPHNLTVNPIRHLIWWTPLGTTLPAANIY